MNRCYFFSLMFTVALAACGDLKDKVLSSSSKEPSSPPKAVSLKEGSQILLNDLNRLSELKSLWMLDKNEKLIGFQATPQNIQQWVDERINYIVPNMNAPLLDERLSSKSIELLASNLGALLFLYVPGSHFFINEEINIHATTPRVGLMMLGPGLFDPTLSPNTKESTAFSNSVHRVATLVHEARHSDGHDDSLSFFHVECPSWHPLAEHVACDRFKNGAYGIGARILVSLAIACKFRGLCSMKESAFLLLEAADALSRVLGDEMGDPTPVAPFKPHFSEAFRSFTN